MASLLDIAPVTKAVVVRGAEIEVCGLAAADFAVLLADYPNIRALIDGAWSRGGAKFEFKQLLTEMPGAVAEIIARGVADKSAGHEALINHAKMIGMADQSKLLLAIFEVTMPEGPGPFADAVVSLLAGNWGAQPPTKEESAIELPPGMEVSEPSSQPPLSASVMLDSAGLKRGSLRRAS
jgi:hypothetical protein